MAQAKQNKFYRTFVRGLMTEASPLTYPEDSSFDELNTVPSRKGNRVRRFGINYSNDNIVDRDYDNRHAKNEFMWEAVSAQPDLVFLVVQEGDSIIFFDRGEQTFSSSAKSFFIDLNDYKRPGADNPALSFCSFAAGKGYLFIVNPQIEPLVVQYNPPEDSIGVRKIAILARDFEGLPDGFANDAEPTNLTKEHFYNLLNQGWISPKP